jgi:WD40 repeat protein
VSRRGKVEGHVFISYAREDSPRVDQLQRTLQDAGIPVWRDTDDLWPGEDWRAKIRQAITDNALVFIVCFSRASLTRGKSYQNEELTLAIEQLRLRRPDDLWLIPVRFDECDIPDRDIGGGRTLTYLQRADLFGERSEDGAARLVAATLQILGRHSDGEAPNTSPGPSQPGFAVTITAGHTKGINSVAFSPDGVLLASGGQDSKIRLWDVDTGHSIGKRLGQLSIVDSVAFSPDGTTLASGGEDGLVRLFDVGTGQKTRTLAVRPAIPRLVYIWAVAFSPDGTTLASAGGRRIRLWDVEAGRLTAVFSGHRANSVTFSPEGTLLASGGQDKTIRLWDVETGRNIATLTGHTAAVKSVAFGPDGAILASGGDSTIRIWEVGTGRNILTFIGATGNRLFHSVRSVSFNPNGTLLASCGNDNVLLWDVQTGRNIATLTGHTAAVQSVAFSPKGSLLASGSWDKTIRLWKV